MSWLEKIRNKDRDEKIKIVWIAAIVAAVLLGALWVATTKIGKTGPKDMTLFQTMSKGFKDVKDNLKK